VQDNAELFLLASDTDAARIAAERLFEATRQQLRPMLPSSVDILHVGATAVIGCLTKGDLDIVIRVEAPEFPQAESVLAEQFRRNAGSIHSDAFAAFVDDTCVPQRGIQLVIRNSPLDHFHHFVAALSERPDLLKQYNNLKRHYHGLAMQDYRVAKASFIAGVLDRR
jgi:GrpB-like predicted nucleotidyltransferase (UPF0157 family)